MASPIGSKLPNNSKNKPFRFEKFWIKHPTFKEHINQWWREELSDQGTRMFKLYKRLEYINYKLKEWNKEIFGNINQEKKSLEDRMAQLQELCIDKGYTKDRKKRRDPNDPGMGSNMPA